MNKRYIYLAILLALMGLFVTRIMFEPKIDMSLRMVPKFWKDERTLVVHSQISGATEVHFPGLSDIKPDQLVAFPLAMPLSEKVQPSSIYAFSGEVGQLDKRVRVDGWNIRVESLWESAGGYNMGAEPKQNIEFLSFNYSKGFGLVTFDGNEASLHKLPLEHNNRRTPVVIWNGIDGEFFAYQPTCRQKWCKRTAWRLSPELEVLETVALPAKNIHYTPEKLRCFSCGCFCYIREDMYAAHGEIYSLVSGRPIPFGQKGLYKFRHNETGPSDLASNREGTHYSPSRIFAVWL